MLLFIKHIIMIKYFFFFYVIRQIKQCLFTDPPKTHGKTRSSYSIIKSKNDIIIFHIILYRKLNIENNNF